MRVFSIGLFDSSKLRIFILKFAHRLIKNLLICLVSQVGDETALFGAKQIAGATDIEVLHGDVDARAQVGEVFESLKSAATLGIECREWRCQQVAERLAIATAHATTHLVQVAQSEVVGTIDDDGVGIGYVDTILNDGGG